MRIEARLNMFYLRKLLRIVKYGRTMGSALAAGALAFFAGVVISTKIWEKFFENSQAGPSADVPVVTFGIVFGVILGLATTFFTARWLWPDHEPGQKEED
jgi:hypothetical protein